MENGKYLVFVSCLDLNPIGPLVSQEMVPPPRWIVFICLKSTSNMNITIKMSYTIKSHNQTKLNSCT